MLNKKGNTLVEVLVALSILIFSFSIMVNILIGAINLAMLAKDKTEASALLQKALTDGISSVSADECGEKDYPTIITGYKKISDKVFESNYLINSKNFYIFFDKKNTDISSTETWDTIIKSKLNSDITIGPSNFWKISAKVTWTYKGQNYEISADQYVRK